MFVINLKNYMEVSGANAAKMAGICRGVADRHGVRIAIAPPNMMLSEIAMHYPDTFAQHMDNAAVGSTTGYSVPELAKGSGVAGSLINHSEHRIPEAEIAALVPRLRKLGMTSIVCVRDNVETERYARLAPDYVAIEPPELIGSGRAVSKERPDLISAAARIVGGLENGTMLLCGAGIVTPADVSRAMELGAAGILVASGIVKSPDWSASVEGFAAAMSRKPHVPVR